MPGQFLDYYTHIADRMLPFLAGRKASIEQRFPRTEKIVYRRHPAGPGEDTWIRIPDRESLLTWVRQYAEGFHGYIRSDGNGAWFVIDIDSRELPTDMAKLAAMHAADVLANQGLVPLVKFSGSDGYHLMFDVPDLEGIEDAALWELERALVRAVACEVEKRLASDPAATPIRDAVGAGNPAITTGSADRENPHALLFDQFILKDNANFRVPFSIHPTTGLAAVPVPIDQLESFNPEDATPENVSADWPDTPMPNHSLEGVHRALQAWQERGC